MNEVHKQKLTLEYIKYDLIKSVISDLPKNAIFLAISIFSCFLAIKLFRYEDNNIYTTIVIIFFGGALCLVSFSLLLAVSMDIMGGINDILSFKKHKFKIEKDKLTDLDKINHIGTSGIFTSLFYFKFEKYGVYELDRRKYYQWSEKYSMNEYSLYNSSQKGDEFYLLIISGKNPVSVYNTKYFKI